MKNVSFKVAKAIKEVGYPQEHEIGYSKFGELITNKSLLEIIADAPTYLEVWFWLWREKEISIDIEHLVGNKFGNFVLGQRILTNGQYQTDPEDAIIEAIEYLVDNDLIK